MGNFINFQPKVQRGARAGIYQSTNFNLFQRQEGDIFVFSAREDVQKEEHSLPIEAPKAGQSVGEKESEGGGVGEDKSERRVDEEDHEEEDQSEVLEGDKLGNLTVVKQWIEDVPLRLIYLPINTLKCYCQCHMLFLHYLIYKVSQDIFLSIESERKEGNFICIQLCYNAATFALF